MWQKVLSKLDHLRPTGGMEEEKEKRGRNLRERNSTLSLGSWRSDRRLPTGQEKKCFLRKEFQVEIRNGEFRQNPRGRSPHTSVNLYLKGCVVAFFPKGDFWLHFNYGSCPILILRIIWTLGLVLGWEIKTIWQCVL